MEIFLTWWFLAIQYMSLLLLPPMRQAIVVFFYSQAQFNQEGKIIGWTPWTKRAFPTSGTTTGVSFFDVDSVTGTIWAVDGQNAANSKKQTHGAVQDYQTHFLLLLILLLAGHANRVVALF